VKPWERWTFGLLAFVVALTGFAYFAMKYLVESDDPFAVVNHPWQPTMLHLHVLASPPLILMFGMILNAHVMRRLRLPGTGNRWSGLASLVMFAVMIVSGYLLQVVSNQTALQALVAAHVGSGAVFSLSYVAHLIISLRLARSWAAMRKVA
jgi:hypothetical protein